MSAPQSWLARGLLDLDEDHGCGDLPERACEEVGGNAARIVTAQTLQSIGDRIVDAKTVLPWLLAAVGAPAGLAGLLVPIRESGALLPQASLVPWVRRRPLRKVVWVAGAVGQGAAVAVMALTAAVASGVAAGTGILVALALFALARSLSSIASKDVLGRTVPKGRRGRINGWTTVTSGVVAITLGLGIRWQGGDEANVGALVAMLAAAALAWAIGAAVYARIREPRGEDGETLTTGWLRHAVALLRDDAPFRRFVLVRTLLLVSALSPPFIVTLAAQETGVGFGSLGPFLVSSGLAGLLGGWVFGRLADRSSRGLMAAGAAASSVVIVAVLLVRGAIDGDVGWWLYPLAYLLLALGHTGVRVARKTYVVDLGSGNQRTDYVAVSNTAMGVLLLATGAVSSGLAVLGVEVALGFLALLGAIGVVAARALPEVSRAT